MDAGQIARVGDSSMIDFLQLVRSMGGWMPLIRMVDIRSATRAQALGYVYRRDGENRVQLTGLGQSVLDDAGKGGA